MLMQAIWSPLGNKKCPSQDQVDVWLRYLKKVSVCDSRLADRPRPAGAIKQ
jgi:hypothetical protein